MQGCSLRCGYTIGDVDKVFRFNTKNLEQCIQDGLNQGVEYDFFLDFGLSHLHFTGVLADLDYLNFGPTLMNVTPFVGGAARPAPGAPLSAIDIARAVAGAVTSSVATTTTPGYGRTHAGFAWSAC